MAFTMEKYNYNELRFMYDKLSLRLTPIENDVRNWLEQGILTGGRPRRYSYEKASVKPKSWPDVMMEVKPEDVDKILEDCRECGEKVLFPMIHFVRAFCNAVHGEPLKDQLGMVEWDVLANEQCSAMDILSGMVQRADLLPFTKHLPEDVLSTLFYEVYVIDWADLHSITNLDVIRQLFLDNEEIGEEERHALRDAYLYYVELPKTGKIADILGQMTPDGLYYQCLSAIQKLHEGAASEAYSLLQDLLKETGASYFNAALTNFTYAVALGLSYAQAPEARTAKKLKAEGNKLMKNHIVTAYDSCYAMRLALHHYITGDASEFYKKNPIQNCKDKMSWRLATLFLRHYQIMDKEPPAVTEAASYVMTEEYDYLRLLYSFDYDELRSTAKKLQQSTGLTTSILPKVKRREQWERTMEELLKLNRPAAAKRESVPSMEEERVVYLINAHSYNVQPKLQKSKDGGITWSKGRNIALSSFQNSRKEYMTEIDRRVARMVNSYSYGWYGGVQYELCGVEVVAALAGCQTVFDEFSNQLIEIKEDPLQLTVRPGEKGYEVKSNVDLDHMESSNISITIEGNRQITVVRVNDKQKKTLELLREVGIFPKKSQQQLTQLLQNLSGSFTVMSPLLKDSTDLKHIEASSLIAVQIAPMPDQFFSISLAVKPFGTHPPYQQPGKGMEIVSTKIDGERVQTERNLQAEQQNLKAVRKMMQPFAHEEVDTNCWQIDTAQCLQLLEVLRTAQEVAFAEWPHGIKMRVTRPMITPDKLRLKISSAGQWFELEGELSIGDKEKMKMAELLEHLREARGNFIRLGDDEYVALSEQLRRQLEAVDKMLLGRGKEMKVAKFNGFQLDGLEKIGVNVKADKPFRELIDRIKETATASYPIPSNIHAELRPYQVEGYEWMRRLAHWGAGACLADDMGLGKTLQAITLIQSRASQGAALVLMPTSLLHNWQQELSRFAPALNVGILNQQGIDRKLLVSNAGAGDVVLSTYGLLVTEGELLSERTWNTIVLDEAHTIKNRDTQTSKGAMTLKGDFRLMLTGTPLQNHLSEIWNLFQFANPGLLGTFQQFTDRFILPIERDHEQERQLLLRRLLSPFLLRRTKDDVLNELPEKTEITLRVELSPEEQALYDNLRQQAIANLEEGSKSALQTLAEITRLRQAACHPKLINKQLEIPSSKTLAFLNLVEELQQSGHRALVFSQFTSHLALVRKALNKQGTSYLYLDGSTSSYERDRLVKKFQTGEEPLFLISLKAGGLGLNLTAADYVVHLDPWWNPAIEDQASDRAHRIGQERPVTVYRLIAAGTIEEKIIRLHQNKRSMADALLQDADMYAQISADDVIRLLRESADAIS